MNKISPENPVVLWWSGGITSALACWLTIQMWGAENCICLYIDTKNEDEDTYRFKADCEKLYGIPIQSITNENYKSIQEVWRKFGGMNFAHGAICSSELKREVRIAWQKVNPYAYQVFGFDISEGKRARSMAANYPDCNPIFPLLFFGLSKKQCLDKFEEFGIEPPRAYKLGLHNNNCLKTGCVQGGIGYWQHMKVIKPEVFDKMADMEHELTDKKGEPVTLCKDQSNDAKESGYVRVFLKPHPDYQHLKSISDIKGRKPKPLLECNGFCGINDLEERSPTEKEVYDSQPNLFSSL